MNLPFFRRKITIDITNEHVFNDNLKAPLRHEILEALNNNFNVIVDINKPDGFLPSFIDYIFFGLPKNRITINADYNNFFYKDIIIDVLKGHKTTEIIL